MMDAQWRRAAAYVACRDERDRLLLTRFSAPGNVDHGKWTMPGGGMEWGERPEETTRRELAEETGLGARIGPLLGVFSHWLEAHETSRRAPGHVLGLVFMGTELDGDLRTEFDEGTTDGASWYSITEALALPHVALVDFVIERIA